MKRLFKFSFSLLLGALISPMMISAGQSSKQEQAPVNVPYGIKENPDDTDIYDVPLNEDFEEEEELQEMTAPKKK